VTDVHSSAHPWMANSVSRIKQEMLAAIGAKSIEELFEQIPADHRLARPLNLPEPLRSESQLKRHLTTILKKNENCEENLNFLGAGCWQHYVPAACEEVVRRTEFLTSVFGSPMSDHGRNQAWFEFCSQIGELVNMDLVGLPVYSWGCAIGHAVRMAARITGRREVLVVRGIDPERLSVLQSYCEPPEMADHIRVTPVAYDPETGLVDLADLKSKLSDRTAAVYFETPSYFGLIESQGATIAELARSHGAETIVGVDPISLGILAAPADFGADIVVGPTQPLGVHMNCGGGVGGFIASRDEVRYAREYPTLMISIGETVKEGEFGFGLSLFHQSSYGMRDKGKDWTGNSVYMWAVANAVYMSLMGPEGFKDIGSLIIQRANYAARLIGSIENVKVRFRGHFFKEFVVDFSGTNVPVAEINRRLRGHKIFGGKDLSRDFPELGECAQFCVTEIHSQSDIDLLHSALREVLAR
jgi:glycine dehydrogenase subunit 1